MGISFQLPCKQCTAVTSLLYLVNLQPCGIELDSDTGERVLALNAHAWVETHPLEDGHELCSWHAVTTGSVLQVSRRDGDDGLDASDCRQHKRHPRVVFALDCAAENQQRVAIQGGGRTPSHAEGITQAHGLRHARLPEAEGVASDAEEVGGWESERLEASLCVAAPVAASGLPATPQNVHEAMRQQLNLTGWPFGDKLTVGRRGRERFHARGQRNTR